MNLLTYLASVALKLLVCVVQRVPLPVALWLGELLGLFSYYIVPRRKRISLENLRHAFKEPIGAAVRDGSKGKAYSERTEKELLMIVREMAKNLGRNMMEFLRLPVMKPKDIDHYIEFVGLDNLDRALAKGKGAFILTAHFGNWDLLAAAMVFKGYPTNLVTKYLKSELLNTLWLDYRRRVKVNILYREGSLRDMVRHLKSNEIMGFVLDQNTKRAEGVFVNFFGRPACTIPSLATLTQRLETPVVPGFIIRKPARYAGGKGRYHRVVYEPALTFQKKETLEESILHNTQLYTDIIERYIRQYPDHWIWLHRRWKTQPR